MKEDNYIAIEGEATNWEEAIRLCGDALTANKKTNDSFKSACIEREKEYPTGLPSAIPVAIPHSMCDGIYESSVCFLRLSKPVEFKRMDNDEKVIQTRLIFNLAIKESGEHIQFLQKLMNFLMDEEAIKHCLELDIDQVKHYLKQNLIM